MLELEYHHVGLHNQYPTMPIIDPHWILELDNVCRAYPHCCIKKARSETPTQQPPMKWQHRHISMRHILQTSWRKLPTQLKQSKTKCSCPYICQRQSTNEKKLKNELHQFPRKDTMSVASPFPNRPRRSIFSHYIGSKKPTSPLKRMFCAHFAQQKHDKTSFASWVSDQLWK